jgi:hypothetical protein
MRWGTRRRSIAACAAVRWLRRLELDAVLLLVIALVRSVAVVAVVGGVCGCGRVRWCGRLVGVAVVRLRVVVTGSGSPSGAVERLTAGLAPSACCEATWRCELGTMELVGGWDAYLHMTKRRRNPMTTTARTTQRTQLFQALERQL